MRTGFQRPNARQALLRTSGASGEGLRTEAEVDKAQGVSPSAAPRMPWPGSIPRVPRCAPPAPASPRVAVRDPPVSARVRPYAPRSCARSPRRRPPRPRARRSRTTRRHGHSVAASRRPGVREWCAGVTRRATRWSTGAPGMADRAAALLERKLRARSRWGTARRCYEAR